MDKQTDDGRKVIRKVHANFGWNQNLSYSVMNLNSFKNLNLDNKNQQP